jgi:hypothetical protein
MAYMSKRMQEVLDVVSNLPPDQQELLLVELLERARDLTGPPTKLTPEERAELEADLAAAKRGELATDEEVTAMFRKHGL